MKNRIGIIGGGQLGRMLAFEAKRLGFDVTVLDPTPNAPAAQVSDRHIVAHFSDKQAIKKLGKESDFLTFEIELANAKVLDELSEKGVSVNPSAKTLSIIKDKLVQKRFLRTIKIPVAAFKEIDNQEAVKKVAEEFGYPLLLKARLDAYDGRGNALIKNKNNISRAFKKLDGRLLYAEQLVPFVKELAVVIARSTKGEIIAYPTVETIHKNNICHLVFAPARVPKSISKKAERLAVKVMEGLKGAGVFAIEMFLDKKGNIYVNEIAPRVHNSGHYTIESSITSQFEQHIRAVTGLPLGSTSMTAPAAVMINILGQRHAKAQVSGLHKAMKISGVYPHIYGKLETKKERKMGHITAVGKNLKEAHKKALKARKFIKI